MDVSRCSRLHRNETSCNIRQNYFWRMGQHIILSGQKRWQRDVALDGRTHSDAFSPAAVWPVAANGKVFIVDPQRAMTAIDINNGKTIWRTFQSKVRESIGISHDGKDILPRQWRTAWFATCTGRQSNRTLASNLGFGYEHAPSMPLECAAWFWWNGNRINLCRQCENGNVIWKHKIDNLLINTVLPLRQKCLSPSSGGNIVLQRIWNKKQKKKN